MKLKITKTDQAIEVETLSQKIERLYDKIAHQKKKLYLETEEKDKAKREQKVQKLIRKLVKKKIKLYKGEIHGARKLKQNGLLIPLAKGDEGTIYTDELADTKSLIELAKIQNWSKKCLWLDLTNEKRYVLSIE